MIKYVINLIFYVNHHHNFQLNNSFTVLLPIKYKSCYVIICMIYYFNQLFVQISNLFLKFHPISFFQ